MYLKICHKVKLTNNDQWEPWYWISQKCSYVFAEQIQKKGKYQGDAQTGWSKADI